MQLFNGTAKGIWQGAFLDQVKSWQLMNNDLGGLYDHLEQLAQLEYLESLRISDYSKGLK